MPSTPTMAAMPMLMPSADSAARTRPAAQPQAADAQQVGPASRRRGAAAGVGAWSRTGRRVTEDPPVADLDAPAAWPRRRRGRG